MQSYFRVKRKLLPNIGWIAFAALLLLTFYFQLQSGDVTGMIIIGLFSTALLAAWYHLWPRVQVYKWGLEEKRFFKTLAYRWSELEGYYIVRVRHRGIIHESHASEIHVVAHARRKPLMYSGFFIANLEEMAGALQLHLSEIEMPEYLKKHFGK